MLRWWKCSFLMCMRLRGLVLRGGGGTIEWILLAHYSTITSASKLMVLYLQHDLWVLSQGAPDDSSVIDGLCDKSRHSLALDCRSHLTNVHTPPQSAQSPQFLSSIPFLHSSLNRPRALLYWPLSSVIFMISLTWETLSWEHWSKWARNTARHNTQFNLIIIWQVQLWYTVSVKLICLNIKYAFSLKQSIFWRWYLFMSRLNPDWQCV